MAATTNMTASLNSPINESRLFRMDRILIIAIDSDVQKALETLLPSEGYEVEIAADAREGLEILRLRPPSALILDPGIPRSFGYDVCEEIVRMAPQVPFMILSTKSDILDKIILLEKGADDYVTIPFPPRELVARLRALIRRVGSGDREFTYIFEEVAVDFSRMVVSRCGEKILLTRKEFKTLEFMAKRAHQIVSREQLLNEVWGYDNYPCTRTIDNHILRLRQKLERDPSHPLHFITVHGVGYRFVP